MSNTLTLNADQSPEITGQEQGVELTDDERESLEIGEKLVGEQDKLLAGKYKTAEELEKAYGELERKLGSKEETTEEATTETNEEIATQPEAEVTFLNSLWEEAQGDGEFKQETLSKLNEMSQQDLAQEYLNYRASKTTQITTEDIKQIQQVAGGEQGYKEMMSWATENVPKGDLEMFDSVLEKDDPLAAFFAVQALNYRYRDAMGVEGEMLTGKAARTEQIGYKSQAELVAAMNDPRYDNDPAYRQQVIAKLDQSKDLEF